MDNLAAKVKQAHEPLTSAAIFSEEEKQKVRNKIAGLKAEQPTRKHDFVPKALTVAVAAGFLLFIGGFIGKEFTTNELHNGSRDSSSIKQQHQDPTSPNFYPNIKVGDSVNGWEMISKGAADGAKTTQSGLLQASFKGSAVIKGNFIFHDDNSNVFPGKLLFFPDGESVRQLPLNPNHDQKVIIDFQAQQQVENMLKLKPGNEKQNVSIEIDEFIANYKKGEKIPDTVHVSYLIQEDGVDIVQEQKLKVDELGRLQLPYRLLEVYKTFAQTQNDGLLKGLTPFDIFQLYLYAEVQKDYKTQYSLFIDDPEYEPTFKTYEEYAAAAKQNGKSSETLLEIIKAGKLEEKMTSEKEAHIVISKDIGLSFGLTRNKIGIWKVKWLPLQ